MKTQMQSIKPSVRFYLDAFEVQFDKIKKQVDLLKATSMQEQAKRKERRKKQLDDLRSQVNEFVEMTEQVCSEAKEFIAESKASRPRYEARANDYEYYKDYEFGRIAKRHRFEYDSWGQEAQKNYQTTGEDTYERPL